MNNKIRNGLIGGLVLIVGIGVGSAAGGGSDQEAAPTTTSAQHSRTTSEPVTTTTGFFDPPTTTRPVVITAAPVTQASVVGGWIDSDDADPVRELIDEVVDFWDRWNEPNPDYVDICLDAWVAFELGFDAFAEALEPLVTAEVLTLDGNTEVSEMYAHWYDEHWAFFDRCSDGIIDDTTVEWGFDAVAATDDVNLLLGTLGR